MNETEKAKELVNKMYNCELDISYYAAKQCALIAVDEIINTVDMCIPYQNEETYVNYWQEVKKEIELL
jgi:uncharacterized protein YutE (UPF0331/DUF86 family)